MMLLVTNVHGVSSRHEAGVWKRTWAVLCHVITRKIKKSSACKAELATSLYLRNDMVHKAQRGRLVRCQAVYALIHCRTQLKVTRCGTSTDPTSALHHALMRVRPRLNFRKWIAASRSWISSHFGSLWRQVALLTYLHWRKRPMP